MNKTNTLQLCYSFAMMDGLAQSIKVMKPIQSRHDSNNTCYTIQYLYITIGHKVNKNTCVIMETHTKSHSAVRLPMMFGI